MLVDIDLLDTSDPSKKKLRLKSRDNRVLRYLRYIIPFIAIRLISLRERFLFTIVFTHIMAMLFLVMFIEVLRYEVDETSCDYNSDSLSNHSIEDLSISHSSNSPKDSYRDKSTTMTLPSDKTSNIRRDIVIDNTSYYTSHCGGSLHYSLYYLSLLAKTVLLVEVITLAYRTKWTTWKSGPKAKNELLVT